MSRRWMSLALLALSAPAGCSWSGGTSTGLASVDRLPVATDVPTTTTTSASSSVASTTVSPSRQECDERGWETASYRPDDEDGGGDDGGDGSVDALRARGRIRVGVDENTLGFAYRNPSTGEIEGFEVELAHAVARALFGDAAGAGAVELVPLVTDQKTPFVSSGEVDMTVSAVTMSCSRWEDVAFSAEYFTAVQQFLVRRDSQIDGRADLDGRTVCVTAGSSSKRIMQQQVPEAVLVEVPDRTGCLLKLQEGDADAYFGHDSFLYGMLVQDPTVEIRTGLLPDDVTVSHYGIAIAKDRIDLVRFVNAVLATMHDDGEWDALYRELQQDLPGLPDATQPVPAYRDAP